MNLTQGMNPEFINAYKRAISTFLDFSFTSPSTITIMPPSIRKLTTNQQDILVVEEEITISTPSILMLYNIVVQGPSIIEIKIVLNTSALSTDVLSMSGLLSSLGFPNLKFSAVSLVSDLYSPTSKPVYSIPSSTPIPLSSNNNQQSTTSNNLTNTQVIIVGAVCGGSFVIIIIGVYAFLFCTNYGKSCKDNCFGQVNIRDNEMLSTSGRASSKVDMGNIYNATEKMRLSFKKNISKP